jgi:hypothetical protein
VRVASVSADLNLPTSAIYALDLAFALPLLATSGAWLLRHEERGPASALAALSWLLGMVTLIAASLWILAMRPTGFRRPVTTLEAV